MEDPPLYFCNKCPKSFNHKIKLAVHKKYQHKTKHSSSDSANDVISFEFHPKDMPLWKFSKVDNNNDTQLKIENPKTAVAIPTEVSSQGQENQLEQIQTRNNSQLRTRGRDIDADNEDGPHEKSQRSGDCINLESTETTTGGSNQIPLPSSLLTFKNPMDPSPKRKSTLKRMEQEGIQTMLKPYKCSYCDYTSAKTSIVKTHERVHTGEKPFKCRYCDHSANQLQNMIRHERSHTGERPYKCGSCDFTTATHSSLACHLMTHTGEKPFKCRYCDHRAIKSSNIKKHERIHTGERPYKCGSCDFTAKVQFSLTRHLKTHGGEQPYECASCDFTGKTSREITRHSKVHWAENKQSYT